jgi:hypothetical protein
MATWKEERDSRLKRETIRIEEVPSADPDHGVVVPWPDPSSFAELGGEGWSTLDESTSGQQGGALREWVLGRGDDERLSVKLFVSSAGPDRARAFFEREALSPVIENPPYRRDQNGEVLTLWLAIPPDETPVRNDSLLRLFRNVVFSVRAFDARVEVRRIADHLLEIALQNPEAPFVEHLPPLPEPEVPREDLRPGRELTLAIPPPTPWRGGKTLYRVQVATAGDAVDFTGLSGERAWFRIPAPGAARIHLQAVDRGTLISKEVNVGFEVKNEKAPPEQGLPDSDT